MPKSLTFAMILFFLFSLSCAKKDDHPTIQTPDGEATIVLAKGRVNKLQSYFNDSLTSTWPLRYPVYKLQIGDVNGDEIDDIAIGVFKRTRYDSVKRKRLFLFQIRHRSIIPLWLGSSLSHPLEDFALVKRDSVTVVRSVEHENDSTFLVAEYQWSGFGFEFRRYLKRQITLDAAADLLD